VVEISLNLRWFAGICYFRLYPRWSLLRVVALVQFVLGCIIMPFGVFFIVTAPTH
jgi:hypothetical protein